MLNDRLTQFVSIDLQDVKVRSFDSRSCWQDCHLVISVYERFLCMRMHYCNRFEVHDDSFVYYFVFFMAECQGW